jgi:hypothetical protein
LDNGKASLSFIFIFFFVVANMEKRNPYSMKNFFLNKDKTLFYISLIDLQDKSKKFYDVRNQHNISNFTAIAMLSALNHNGLIDYDYEKARFTYYVKYTKKGNLLREETIKYIKSLMKLGLWKKEDIIYLEKK